MAREALSRRLQFKPGKALKRALRKGRKLLPKLGKAALKGGKLLLKGARTLLKPTPAGVAAEGVVIITDSIKQRELSKLDLAEREYATWVINKGLQEGLIKPGEIATMSYPDAVRFVGKRRGEKIQRQMRAAKERRRKR